MAREITGGWETGNIVAEGFTSIGAGVISSSASLRHVDRNGNGGVFAINGSSAGANPARHILQQTAHVRPTAEAWDRATVQTNGASGRVFVLALYDGTTEVCSIRFDTTDRTVDAYLGSGTLAKTSDTGVFPVARYFNAVLHFRLHGTDGLMEVFVDDALVLSYAGDTLATASTTFRSPGYAVSTDWIMDEYCRNSITLEYDGGTGGVPVAGETITGGTSGATAVITSVEGDATSGVLVLQQWDDVDFLDDEPLTSPSMAALVNAPDDTYVSGFQPNSTRPGTGFVVVFKPTDVGATTQLASSTGAANWTTVDEVPPNTTDYNFSGTNGQYDTYATSDTLPASAVSVIAVSGYIYALRDGTAINNAGFVVRLSGTDYPSKQSAPLATDHAAGWFNFNVSPVTRSQWSVAELTGVEFGPQVRV